MLCCLIIISVRTILKFCSVLNSGPMLQKNLFHAEQGFFTFTIQSCVNDPNNEGPWAVQADPGSCFFLLVNALRPLFKEIGHFHVD